MKTSWGSSTLKKWAPADRLAHDAGLLGPKAKCLQAEPFVLFPEVFESLAETHGSRDTVTAQILLDSCDELRTMIQACSVINCANITSVQLRASGALNRRRHAKGQQPIFDYKVLQLAGERRAQSRSQLGGAHASPRMHLRRGHIRRLDSRPIWIRPTTVNAGSKLGLVLKDYAVSDPGFGQAVKRGGR
jgi:hypothetical protein